MVVKESKSRVEARSSRDIGVDLGPVKYESNIKCLIAKSSQTDIAKSKIIGENWRE